MPPLVARSMRSRSPGASASTRPKSSSARRRRRRCRRDRRDRSRARARPRSSPAPRVRRSGEAPAAVARGEMPERRLARGRARASEIGRASIATLGYHTTSAGRVASMSDVVRYGIIGTGMMGCEHIRNLALVPGVEGHGDRRPARAEPSLGTPRGGREGVEVYEDYRGSCSRSAPVDAVVIASPNYTHFDVLQAVFETRKHVLDREAALHHGRGLPARRGRRREASGHRLGRHGVPLHAARSRGSSRRCTAAPSAGSGCSRSASTASRS